MTQTTIFATVYTEYIYTSIYIYICVYTVYIYIYIQFSPLQLEETDSPEILYFQSVRLISQEFSVVKIRNFILLEIFLEKYICKLKNL